MGKYESFLLESFLFSVSQQDRGVALRENGIQIMGLEYPDGCDANRYDTYSVQPVVMLEW